MAFKTRPAALNFPCLFKELTGGGGRRFEQMADFAECFTQNQPESPVIA